MNEEFAKEEIERWISAWNHHSLKEIVSLYSENILFCSPKLTHIYPNLTSAQITNRVDLEKYFSLGLKKYPNLHFTPLGYFLRDQIVVLEYSVTPENNTHWSVMEKFEFDKHGLINKSSAFYGVEY
ncbi:MAG: nuclear transport factor 2 family protein [Nitrososphaeraceae archaeon]